MKTLTVLPALTSTFNAVYAHIFITENVDNQELVRHSVVPVFMFVTCYFSRQRWVVFVSAICQTVFKVLLLLLFFKMHLYVNVVISSQHPKVFFLALLIPGAVCSNHWLTLKLLCARLS